MTEQYICDGSEIYDKEGEYLFQGFMELDGVLIVEKLNEQYKTIKQLKKENERLKNKLKFFNELNEPYGTIIEENERLKKENKDLEAFRYNVFKSMDKARIWREKKLKARKNS